ncbi:MAG: metal-binding (seleno)protein [Desulfuromonadales bacterium]|nr:metal-binding (seleno)protein [Desulfuromonadales bacterium]
MKKILQLSAIPLLLGGLIVAPAALPTSCGCSGTCGVSSARAAESSTAHLALDGLTCAACTFAVKGALSRLDGVEQVDVSYEDRRARVLYDPEKVTPQQLVEAVNNTGYRANVPPTTEAH